MTLAQHQSSQSGDTDDLIRQMESLRRKIRKQVEHYSEQLAGLPPERLFSAHNLLHYMALRQQDIRPLQDLSLIHI